MNTYVCPKVRAYIENEILPRYDALPGHTGSHINNVIERSLKIVSLLENTDTEVDVNMVYVIAAYHDLGREIANKTHHEWSAYLLRRDEKLNKLFLPEEIEIMAEAVEDHRASASHAPRSIYGRIVAEADRDLRPDVVFQRAIDFGLDNYPQLTEEQQWQRFREHMTEKYSATGYIQLWIEGSENHHHLEELRKIIKDSQQLHSYFTRLYPKAKEKRF
jgi:uncharacterized protein